MPTIQELRDQRASAWAHAQEFNTRAGAGEEMSAEDEAAWERALAEVDRLGTLIDNRETTAGLEERFAQVDSDHEITGGNRSGGDDGEAEYRQAFEGMLRWGLSELTPEERAALQARSSLIGARPSRAQSVGSGSAGGYTAPQGFWAKVTETMKFYASVATVAEGLNTTDGNTIPWPTNDDTANTGRLLAENTQVTETAVTFGQAQLDAYTYSSDLVLIPLQLLQDSGIDIEAFVAKKLGQRLGRIVNSHYTTGTGSSQPQGYITGATTGKTTASATAITYDEIIDLVHSVDVAYRTNARFALHDSVLAYVRKIRDDVGGAGVGRPIWEPSVQAGVPDNLLGYPLFVNNFQDSAVTATKKTMAFGDFSAALVVRTVAGGQLMRLAERYADHLQVGFFGFLRTDSVVQDSSAVKLLVQHS